MIRVRHKHGFHASDEQINVVVDIARATRMDESWFGEIIEAKAQDGSTVHVVRDLERGSWLTFKYAVSLVDQGICSPRDYVFDKEANVFEELLRQLGIIDPKEDIASSWYSRFVSDSKFKIGVMRRAILEEDRTLMRPTALKMNVRRKDGLYFFDAYENEIWSRSMSLWLARRKDMLIAHETWFRGIDGIFHHVVHDGKMVILAEALNVDSFTLTGMTLLPPQDIVADRIKKQEKGKSK